MLNIQLVKNGEMFEIQQLQEFLLPIVNLNVKNHIR